jgi:uracil-DNA glycosylase
MAEECTYGYPPQCAKCVNISQHKISLRVAPYYRAGTGARVMLIGQDPTIFKQPNRVIRVLMLDQPNGQLSRWLRELLGEGNFDTLTLYVTNLVKCSFDNPPSTTAEGGLKFLRPYFENCRSYLREEPLSFHPHLALTSRRFELLKFTVTV